MMNLENLNRKSASQKERVRTMSKYSLQSQIVIETRFSSIFFLNVLKEQRSYYIDILSFIQAWVWL